MILAAFSVRMGKSLGKGRKRAGEGKNEPHSGIGDSSFMADAPVHGTGNSDRIGQDAPASRYALLPVKGCPTAYRSATLPLDRQPPSPFPRPCRGEQINKVSLFPRFVRLYGMGQLRSELRPETFFFLLHSRRAVLWEQIVAAAPLFARCEDRNFFAEIQNKC